MSSVLDTRNKMSNGTLIPVVQALMSHSQTEISRAGGTPLPQSPVLNNAPKYGTLVPNRIFIGGIACTTTEVELAQLFSTYGNVKSTKIISDRAGVSKGYGFVTFEQDEEAKRVLREGECIYLRERKLNIAPAIKKQPFSRALEDPSVCGASTGGTYFYGTGLIPPNYNYQGGLIYYNPTQSTPAMDQRQIFQSHPGVYSVAPAHPQQSIYPTMNMMYQCGPHPLCITQSYPY